MEYKQYKRYTKPVSKKEIQKEKMDMTKCHTKTGIATFIRRSGFSNFWSLSMRIDKERIWFKYDNLAKFIFRNIDKKEKITVEFFEGKTHDENYIVSFTNHKRGYTITNQRYRTILDYQLKKKAKEDEEERKRHTFNNKCHDLLCNYTNEPFMYFVLLRKENPNSKYNYKLLKIERPSKIKGENKLFSLLAEYIEVPQSHYEQHVFLYRYFGGQGNFYDVPNTHITILVSHSTNYKKRECVYCGSSIEENFSMPVGDIVAPRYFCSYCFFEKNKIEVPKTFFNQKLKSNI